MSEIKVNKISPRTACGTTTLGDSGDTFNLPSGATLTVASGATITNNGTQTGFGREGSVNWQTGSIKTSTFTATSGEGYFVNSGSALTMNLPAGSAGAIVAVADYARNFATYNLTVSPNGSEKIGGVDADAKLTVDGQAATFVYVDATKGWVNVQNAEDTEAGIPPYIGATGGTEATCGNFKTHIFTSPGTFTVSRTAVCAADNVVDYLVVAGGGGGAGDDGPSGSSTGGGGGAGGARTFQSTPTTNPLKAPAGITVTATAFPITVGAGGSAGPKSSPNKGGQGNDSTFSTITSAGGGFAVSNNGSPTTGNAGGSGGGAYAGNSGGAGNTPPVSPPQGNGVGANPGTDGGTGGGGFGGASPGSAPTNAGTAGGIGSYVPDAFIGPTAPSYGTPGPESNTRYFAGGGGGGGHNAAGGAGGAGGGATGANSYGPGGAGDPAPSGTANTGGGGGGLGAAAPGGENGGAGGSGIVMIDIDFNS